MCSLCGILGGRGHWTESASSPEVFAGRAEAHTPGRERQHRTRILNVVLRHYGLSLSDWTAGRSVLRSATGRSALVENVGELWPAAERLAGRPLDPLDPALLAALAPPGSAKLGSRVPGIADRNGFPLSRE